MPRGMKKGLDARKFERYVTKVKRKGTAKNAYAVCKRINGWKEKGSQEVK